MKRLEDLFPALHGIIKSQLWFLGICSLAADKEWGAEIAFAAVGKYRHYCSAAKPSCTFHGRKQGRAAAHTGKDALFSCQPAHHAKGVFIGHIDNGMGQLFIKNCGLVGFLHVFQALDLMTKVGLNGNDPYFGMELVKPA